MLFLGQMCMPRKYIIGQTISDLFPDYNKDRSTDVAGEILRRWNQRSLLAWLMKTCTGTLETLSSTGKAGKLEMQEHILPCSGIIRK